MRVAVVGGGIVGLCTAEALARRGAEVVVIEAGTCGGAASAGNAGWITPAFAAPLPAPGAIGSAMRWMASRRGPLRIHPVMRPSFVRWLYAFARSTRRDRHRAGMAALVALCDRAIEEFDALASRGVTFEGHERGLLIVARAEASLAGEIAQLRAQQDLGYRGETHVLDHREALALEPGLNQGVVGAVLIADERHVRPETLNAGLLAHLRDAGVEIYEHTRVRRIVGSRTHWHAECSAGSVTSVQADRLVVAAGVASSALLAPLGIELPLQGAKGYSITQQHPPIPLSRPIYMLEAKVVASPFASGLRLAGTLELGARGLGIDRRRLRSLDDAGERYFSTWEPEEGREAWAGLRPLLPDGLPAIGPVPGRPGLFVSTGHGMLGVTLGPATAEALVPAVLNGRPALRLAPFSVARFVKGAA